MQRQAACSGVVRGSLMSAEGTLLTVGSHPGVQDSLTVQTNSSAHQRRQVSLRMRMATARSLQTPLIHKSGAMNILVDGGNTPSTNSPRSEQTRVVSGVVLQQ